MKSKKASRNAFLSSLLSLFLCFAMLLGTTFAWFTDTSATAVNTIQAGTLDVKLVDENGVSLEGQSLKWVKADGAPAGEQVLWEPGCTYNLQKFYVKNEGDLKLKFKVVITGIGGDAKLNEVITWKLNGAALNSVADVTLGAGEISNAYTISGHMQEDAGNDYQGLSIKDIAITVYATQVKGEYDSFGNNYDEGATTEFAALVLHNSMSTPLEKGKTYTIGDATVTVAANGDTTYTNSGAAQTVSITTYGGNLTVNAPDDTIYHYGTANVVTINAIAGNSFHACGKVAVLSIAKGRVVAEKGNNIDVIQVKNDTASTAPVVIAVPQNVVLTAAIQKAEGVSSIKIAVIDSKGDEIADKTFVTATGKETTADIPEELQNVLSTTVDKITDAKDYVARIDDKFYETLEGAFAEADGKTITLLTDCQGNGIKVLSGKTISVDFNGYTYNIDGTTVGSAGTETNGFQLLKDSTITFKNGALTSTKAKLLIQNYSDLKLDNMNLSATAPCTYVLSNNNGNVVINDTTITAPEGKVAFDVYSFSDYAGPNVTVQGNSVINGKVEIGENATNPHKLVLNVTGGTFNGEIVKSAVRDFTGNITGGTFVSDPTDYLAKGYSSKKVGNVYTIFQADLAIGTADELFAFAKAVNGGDSFAGKKVVLISNIDLIGKEWTPIGSSGSVASYPSKTFSGTFDGQGHTISNLTASKDGEWAAVGLFGTANRATIQNVVIDGADIRSTHYAGGILGYDTEWTTVSGCTVKNSTIVSAAENSTGSWDNGDKVGGIVGYMSAPKIQNCRVENTSIQGYRDLGGIIGYAGGGTVSDCSIKNVAITIDNDHNYKNYTTTAEHDANSIVGENHGTATNCTGTATIAKQATVSTSDELVAALTADVATIEVKLGNDIDLPIASLGDQIPGSGQYRLGGENTTQIVIDLNGHQLNLTTTYMSALGAKNPDATMTIKNGTMTSTGNSTNTWNIYDIILKDCAVVLDDVNFLKPLALDNAGKKTVMKNVVIADTDSPDDAYMLWLCAGVDVEIDGLNINGKSSTGHMNRAIKIADQYVTDPDVTKLSVKNATITSDKKAAVLVTSTAGAAINWGAGNDISGVAADSTNAVWNDADRTSAWDLVTVTGCTKVQES